MKPKVKTMTVVQYFDEVNYEYHRVDDPSWDQVEHAIEKMDNNAFPIVLLSCCKLAKGLTGFDDENSFNIIGGNGRIALFHFMEEWQYVNKSGDKKEVKLWKSDQGYYCQERNIIKDIRLVKKLVREFYTHCDFSTLNAIEI